MTDRRVAPRKGSFGGKFKPGRPNCIVVHSLEAPAIVGIALSLAEGWFQSRPVSIHAMTDPGESIDMVDLDTVAYHAGGGNQYGVGDEHTGYAAWSKEQWLEKMAFAALRLGAKKVAEQARKLGWSARDLRWLSIAQLRAGERGLCTHNDIRLAFGGTTHTDPGPNFPYAIFLQMVQQFFGAAVAPATNPNPQPTGQQTGGAEAEEDFMRAIFFRYYPDDGEIVAAAEAGRPRPPDRIFESDGATFWHVPRAETLRDRLAFLAQIGVKPLVAVNGQLIDAGGIDSITGAPIVPDPHVYGREVGSAA